MHEPLNPASAGGAAGFGGESTREADDTPNTIATEIWRRTPCEIDRAVAEFLARDEYQDGSADLLDWAARERINLRPAHELNVAMSVLPVEFLPGGTFEFAEDGQGVPAFVTLVLDADAETTVDIVATKIARPTRFATLLGVGEVLGLDCALNPSSYYAGRALHLATDPIAWLRAGCAGACLLRPDAAWRILPSFPGSVVVDDLNAARRLVRAAEGFVEPHRILVREAA